MLKSGKIHATEGNKIYCSGKDDWDTVKSVKVGGEKCSFQIIHIKVKCDIHLHPIRIIDLHPPIPHLLTVKFTDYHVNIATLIRCQSIMSLGKEPHGKKPVPYVQEASTGASLGDSNDEGPPDDEVPQVFTDGELYMFQSSHRKLYMSLGEAKEVNFQNAYGKMFLQQFCEFLLPSEEFRCLDKLVQPSYTHYLRKSGHWLRLGLHSNA